ncbi:MAG: 50S ribosomal protein L10 [Bacteroidia bacterium]|nr:50S ribosomal protein L10 [Bacteroidia bacterium]MDW8302125.1 50S ribosomal protein L10 [Bacteroidia bacterium]
MTREEKIEIVNKLTEKLKNSPNFYVIDASDFTVAKSWALRAACYKAGLELRFYKNSLIKKALENLEGDYSPIIKSLKGSSSSIIFGATEPKTPAKVILDFRKDEAKPALKAAKIGEEIYVGDEQLNMLSKIKTKSELIGEIIALLQSPINTIISGLQNRENKEQ